MLIFCRLSVGSASLKWLVKSAATNVNSLSLSTEKALGVNRGVSLTGLTVIVKLCSGDALTPPLRVPPSSYSRTVTVAVPYASAAGVYVSVPSAAMAGCTANSALLSLLTAKSSACPASFAGPALTFIAQPTPVCAPQSSSTCWSAPFVNDGASFTALTSTVIV